jgi:chromosomal replication initiation ATPase DnaA
VQSVADDFAISYGELIGEGRSRHLVEARVVVVAVLRERGWSFPRIGKLIGGRDHSTIIWAHQNFDIHAKRNPRVLNLYKQYRPDSPVEVAR